MRLIFTILTIWTDDVSVEVFEFSKLPLAINTAPMIGCSPEVLHKIFLISRCKSAMCAWNLACGNLIRRWCVFCLILFTPTSYQMLEQIVFHWAGLPWRCFSLVDHLKSTSWSSIWATVVSDSDMQVCSICYLWRYRWCKTRANKSSMWMPGSQKASQENWQGVQLLAD